jgi:hypothetical protein
MHVSPKPYQAEEAAIAVEDFLQAFTTTVLLLSRTAERLNFSM